MHSTQNENHAKDCKHYTGHPTFQCAGFIVLSITGFEPLDEDGDPKLEGLPFADVPDSVIEGRVIPFSAHSETKSNSQARSIFQGKYCF